MIVVRLRRIVDTSHYDCNRRRAGVLSAVSHRVCELIAAMEVRSWRVADLSLHKQDNTTLRLTDAGHNECPIARVVGKDIDYHVLCVLVDLDCVVNSIEFSCRVCGDCDCHAIVRDRCTVSRPNREGVKDIGSPGFSG